jgi:RNA polymerase primary sigma factor
MANHTNNLNTVISIANPNDKLNYNRYMADIGKLKPFTREEEAEIFQLVEAGDKRAIDKVCMHNLLFVVSVAKRYSALIGTSTLTLEDLINEGNIGLIEAITRFNYREGNKFISYAIWWIKQAILTCIQRNVKTIRIPSNVRGEINRMLKQEEILSQKLGRNVSNIEIFEAMLGDGEQLDYDKLSKLNNAMKMSRYEQSIDVMVGNSDDSTLEVNQTLLCPDVLADDMMIYEERKKLTLQILSKIPPRAQDFIRHYYGIDTKPITYKAIGELYDVTPETVRQSVMKYLRKMKYSNIDNAGFFFPKCEYGLRRMFKDYDKNTLYLI